MTLYPTGVLKIIRSINKMKKLLVVFFGCLMLFLTGSVLACDKDCDCGCQEGKKCTCEKCKCLEDCDCGCHKGEKCTKEDCNCACHKKKCKCNGDCKCECKCACKEGKECTCEDCKCKKSKKSFKNFFKRNKIKCNCEE